MFGEAAAKQRAGTVWVDLVFPEYPSYGAPTWNLRTSPGLLTADRNCERDIVVREVLPALQNTNYARRGEAGDPDSQLTPGAIAAQTSLRHPHPDGRGCYRHLILTRLLDNWGDERTNCRHFVVAAVLELAAASVAGG